MLRKDLKKALKKREQQYFSNKNQIKQKALDGLRQQLTVDDLNNAQELLNLQQINIQLGKYKEQMSVPFINHEQWLQGNKSYFDKLIEQQSERSFQVSAETYKKFVEEQNRDQKVYLDLLYQKQARVVGGLAPPIERRGGVALSEEEKKEAELKRASNREIIERLSKKKVAEKVEEEKGEEEKGEEEKGEEEKSIISNTESTAYTDNIQDLLPKKKKKQVMDTYKILIESFISAPDINFSEQNLKNWKASSMSKVYEDLLILKKQNFMEGISEKQFKQIGSKLKDQLLKDFEQIQKQRRQ